MRIGLKTYDPIWHAREHCISKNVDFWAPHNVPFYGIWRIWISELINVRQQRYLYILYHKKDKCVKYFENRWTISNQTIQVGESWQFIYQDKCQQMSAVIFWCKISLQYKCAMVKTWYMTGGTGSSQHHEWDSLQFVYRPLFSWDDDHPRTDGEWTMFWLELLISPMISPWKSIYFCILILAIQFASPTLVDT